MYQIKSNLPVNGIHWGLEFVNGIAETDSKPLAERLARKGYTAQDMTPPEPELPKEPELPPEPAPAPAPDPEPEPESKIMEPAELDAPEEDKQPNSENEPDSELDPQPESEENEEPDEPGLETDAAQGITCPKCGKECKSAAGLAKHLKTCEG